jgi:hypothetical protein
VNFALQNPDSEFWMGDASVIDILKAVYIMGAARGEISEPGCFKTLVLFSFFLAPQKFRKNDEFCASKSRF